MSQATAVDTLQTVFTEHAHLFEESTKNQSVFVEVTSKELAVVAQLDEYIEETDHQKARNFFETWEDQMSCYVEINLGDETTIQISAVVSKNLTNELVEDFVRTFWTNIHTEFDPLAEEHDTPYVAFKPL